MTSYYCVITLFRITWCSYAYVYGFFFMDILMIIAWYLGDDGYILTFWMVLGGATVHLILYSYWLLWIAVVLMMKGEKTCILKYYDMHIEYLKCMLVYWDAGICILVYYHVEVYVCILALQWHIKGEFFNHFIYVAKIMHTIYLGKVYSYLYYRV